MFVHRLSYVVAGIALLFDPAASQSTSLPTVDLGYEIHRASLFNVCLRYWGFLRMPSANYDRPLGASTTSPTSDTHSLLLASFDGARRSLLPAETLQ